MRLSLKQLISIVIGSALCAGAMATVPDGAVERYGNIPERNLFGLKPPEPMKEISTPPQVPKIILTGITTILGNKRALMKTQPQPGKPGEQAKELSLILTEGQREGEIEVLQIDETAGSVKVNNSGTVMTLTFEKDGAKLPATPPPPPIPGVAPLPGSIPAPFPNPVNANLLQTNNPGIRPFPTRNFRLPATRGVPSPAGGASTPGGVVPGATPVTQLQGLTPEEQTILQQIHREAAPPLPGATLATPNQVPAVPPAAPTTVPPVYPQ
jgi:hypothetical protein